MATFYSNRYRFGPNAIPGSPWIYRGATGHIMAKGSPYLIDGTFTNTAALPFGGTAGDVLKLCAVPKGAKLRRFVAVPSADLDGVTGFTFNLGLTSNTNCYASASAGLQTAAAFIITDDTLLASPIAAKNDELLLTRVAASLTVAGTINYLAEFYFPAD